MAARHARFGRAAVALTLFVSAQNAHAEPTSTAPANAGFGARGDVIVSVERISPFAIIELERTGQGHAEISRSALATFGDTPTTAPIERMPRLALDVAVRPGVTLGGSVYFATILAADSSSNRGIAVGWAPRLGYALRVSKSMALWTHAGLSYVAVTTPDATAARLEGTFDAAFAIFPASGVALTLTPSVDIALAGNGASGAFSTGRFMFTAGLLGHTEGTTSNSNSNSTPTPARDVSKPGHVTVSADRMLPLVDYSETVGASSTYEIDGGITHAFTRDHELFPRFAADVTIARNFTVGTAFGFNITPWETIRDSAYEINGRVVSGPVQNVDVHTLSFGAEPRIGFIKALSDHVAVWLRGGLTYTVAFVAQTGYHAPVVTNGVVTLAKDASESQVAHALYLSLDPEAIYYVTHSFGLTVGPVMDLTLLGGFRDQNAYPVGLPGPPIFHLGATAGALISF